MKIVAEHSALANSGTSGSVGGIGFGGREGGVRNRREGADSSASAGPLEGTIYRLKVFLFICVLLLLILVYSIGSLKHDFV